MLFADTALAARIERAEMRLVADCATAIAKRRPDAGVIVRPVAGGVATFTGPGSPLNKVAGVGFGGPLDEAALAGIERDFAQRETAVQIELATLADPSIAAALTRRGYALIGFENVLGLKLPAAIARRGGAADETDVAACTDADLDRWFDLVVTAFASPDTQGVPSHESFDRGVLEQIIRDMAAAPGFVRYFARRAGALAGGASMRICNGVAQLCGAATLPEHRRRGLQSAMLAARLHDAAQLGGDIAVVTTLPGSKSQQNSQRHGFELLYARTILRRECAPRPV